MSEPFDELRARIVANDRAIVELVNARLRLVEELWRLKAERRLPQLDPEREQALLDALDRTNAGPLSPAGLRGLVTELLTLTKRELGDSSGNR